MQEGSPRNLHGILPKVVAISALGYFVDILDLFLFSVLRVPSLEGVGVAPPQFLSAGATLLNWQMAGLLFGCFFWGALGDRYGRVRALYGSILLYSLSTLANAFVTSLPAYAACRFLAGLGLSGELGAAVTLVSETLPTARRGLGTMVVAGFGLCGGVAAAGMAEVLDWRTCYAIGGFLGLGLLILRVQLLESPLFLHAARRSSTRSDTPWSFFIHQFLLLIRSSRRRGIYLRLLLCGVPIWFVAGILMVFSPEFARALGVPGVTAARAVLCSYMGVVLGDFLSGLLSQLLGRRKQAILIFLILLSLQLALFLRAFHVAPLTFYALCFALGIGTGYWAVLITCAAEHFGTNLRATVATSVPNFIRASVIPLSFAFQQLLHSGPRRTFPFAFSAPGQVGPIEAATILAVVCLGGAFLALHGLQETYSRNLDFEEFA